MLLYLSPVVIQRDTGLDKPDLVYEYAEQIFSGSEGNNAMMTVWRAQGASTLYTCCRT